MRDPGGIGDCGISRGRSGTGAAPLRGTADAAYNPVSVSQVRTPKPYSDPLPQDPSSAGTRHKQEDSMPADVRARLRSSIEYNTVSVVDYGMERATIIVSGMVQGVGFRYTVRASAASLKISGYVKNLEDGTVEIVAEGARQNTGLLIQNIRSAVEPAIVEDALVSYQKATGEFKSFSIMPGDILKEMVEGFATENALLVRSNEKQDGMLEKQDQTVSEIQGLSNNMHDMMDRRFQRLEGDVRQIKEKIGL